MAWLTENWIWVLFGLGFIAIHLFGHGGHGGHGGQGGHGGGHCGDGGGRDAERQKAGDKPATGPSAGAPSNHEPHRH